MPVDNAFRHQTYSDEPPNSVYHLVKPSAQPAVDSDEFKDRMAAAGEILSRQNVAAIYLVHGTFVGQDALGLWTELSRLLPGLGDTLREVNKKWVDVVIGNHGNYTQQFARLLENGINQRLKKSIPVKLFHWSSENHHIGRADGAIRLIDELIEAKHSGRVILWGHSHAGNVFALMTNLLGGTQQSVEKFFAAAKPYYRSPIFRHVDLPTWERLHHRLCQRGTPLPEAQLDFVTFGTPIRYGWETGSYEKLLHVVNHHPLDHSPEYLTTFPPKVAEVLTAADGDYVQQFGIAGSNVIPNLLAWRALWADRRLNCLLQPGLRARHLPQRLKLGMRVPEEGTTLLVDYGRPTGNIAQHHAGHAVYTNPDWLLFHVEQTVKYLFEDDVTLQPRD